jgi:XTP/dITP diphosphohydrolase
MTAPARVIVASRNRHKVTEIAALLGTLGIEVTALPDDAPEVEETAPDFAGNAWLKAETIAGWLRTRGEPGDTAVLADDSGLCVDALGGAPGVISARFAGEPCDDSANNAKLVAQLVRVGVERSAAHYVCALALVRVDAGLVGGRVGGLQVEATWDVQARTTARGTGGFGYDPHCWLLDAERTVAELTPPEKAARSHRGAALRALVAALRDA